MGIHLIDFIFVGACLNGTIEEVLNSTPNLYFEKKIRQVAQRATIAHLKASQKHETILNTAANSTVCGRILTKFELIQPRFCACPCNFNKSCRMTA